MKSHLEFKKYFSRSSMLEYLKSQGITKPTEIQKESIPSLLKDGHFTIQGMTGSGKTYAYLLPVIEKLKVMEELKLQDEENSGDEELASPKAVILVPTRELALQIFSIAKDISHHVKLRTRKLIGGDKGKSLDSLFRSQIDLLVTTPDRCLRAFKNGELKKKSLKYFVLDEADQLLEPSFKVTVQELCQYLNGEEEQVFLVSASRPPEFSTWLKEFFPNKTFGLIGKGKENVLNHQVKTVNINLTEEEKNQLLNNFIESHGKGNGIIFTGNKARSKSVFLHLSKIKESKIYLLHKDLERNERLSVVQNFIRTGGVIVATDIFARGVDIDHLQWVLNYDLPTGADYYLHRVGRVGRAGRFGSVFNFVTLRDEKRWLNINQALVEQGRGDLRLIKPKSKKLSQKTKKKSPVSKKHSNSKKRK